MLFLKINSMRHFYRNVTICMFTRSISDFKNTTISCRNYATLPKRFYKNTGIVCSDGQYEVTLDQKKLKTPKGNVLKLNNEILALMIANEWDAQKDEIQPSSMHLTALCNTALDNPNNIIKEEAVDRLVEFLETDTILYHSNDEEVYALQQREWDPIISWFCTRYNVNITPTKNLIGPIISNETKDTIRNYLLSYNFNAIHGFNLSIESLKSLILAFACVDKNIGVDHAVLLSRLEEEYQAGRWGRVEWSHDVSQLDLQTRVAAGTIFVQLNSLSEQTQTKLDVSDYSKRKR